MRYDCVAVSQLQILQQESAHSWITNAFIILHTSLISYSIFCLKKSNSLEGIFVVLNCIFEEDQEAPNMQQGLNSK